MVDKNNRRSRRAFLKATGAGIGFGTLGIASAQSKHDMVTIPILKSGNETIRQDEVPRNWYNQLKQARKAREQVEQIYGNNPGVKAIGLKPTSDTVNGLRTTKVDAQVIPNLRTGNISSNVNGVEVTTSKFEKPTLVNCNNQGSFSNIPGGVVIENGTGSYSYGSTTCRAYYRKKSKHFLLTAGHLFDACSQSGVRGSPAYQNGERIGSVAYYSPKEDWAAIKRENFSLRYDDTIKTSSRHDLRGYVTEDGVAKFMNNGTQVRKMGVTTGETSGQIQQMYLTMDGCINWKGNGIQTDCNNAPGDSGGPAYFINNNGRYFLLHNITHASNGLGRYIKCPGKSRSLVQNYTYGTAAYQMNSFFNFNT